MVVLNEHVPDREDDPETYAETKSCVRTCPALASENGEPRADERIGLDGGA